MRGYPDTGRAELYNLKEQRKLIDAPEAEEKLAELKAEPRLLQEESGALPDEMPVNSQLSQEMPNQSIREDDVRATEN